MLSMKKRIRSQVIHTMMQWVYPVYDMSIEERQNLDRLYLMVREHNRYSKKELYIIQMLTKGKWIMGFYLGDRIGGEETKNEGYN